MLARLRSRLTYANVVSTLCLFLLLGGTAYAAATIGSAEVIDNSLQSVDLRDNAVKSRDVADDNVSGGGLVGSDIRDGGVGNTDIAGNSIRSGKVVDGSLLGRDIAKTATRFTTDMGTIPANACATRTLSSFTLSDNDHLVLTPDLPTTSRNVSYDVQNANEGVVINACNPTGSDIAEGNTTFNLLVIGN